jgi:hypothetical protein
MVSEPHQRCSVKAQIRGKFCGIFSRFKDERRLTLKANPHFYENLPTSPGEYDGQFRTDPVETFQQEKISVLTDDPRLMGRVFLETAEEKRVFGNIWVIKSAKDAIIFKGSYLRVPFSHPLTFW